MWRLLVKDNNNEWQDLDIEQDAIVLDFEYLNAEKLEDRYASASWSFDIAKTTNNNRLIQLNIQQAYSINKTYVECRLFNDNSMPLGMSCYLQILSEDSSVYKAQVLSTFFDIFKELEKIGFNENNTRDSEYHNALGYYRIPSNQVYYSGLIDHKNFFDTKGNAAFKSQQSLVKNNNLSTFTFIDRRFSLYTNNFLQFKMNGLIKTLFSTVGVYTELPSYSTDNYTYSLSLIPKIRSVQNQPLKYKDDYTITTVERASAYGNTAFVVSIPEGSEIANNRVTYFDSNRLPAITPTLRIQINSKFDENGVEILPFDTVDEQGNIKKEGLIEYSKDYSKLLYFQIYGKRPQSTEDYMFEVYGDRFANGLLEDIFFFLYGLDSYKADYGGNFDNWSVNADGTHSVVLYINDAGSWYHSSPDNLYEIIRYDKVYSVNSTSGTYDFKCFWDILQYNGDSNFWTGIRKLDYVDFDFNVFIMPETISKGYYLTQATAEPINGIGDYTGNSYVNLQNIIGYDNAKELVLDFLRITGSFVKQEVQEGDTRIISVELLPNNITDNIVNMEITEKSYELDEKYNSRSYVGSKAQTTLYYDINSTSNIELYNLNGRVNTLEGSINLQYINNPRYNNEEKKVLDLKIVELPTVRAYSGTTRVWTNRDYAPLIPYNYNGGALESDGIYVDRLDIASNISSYIDYFDTTFTAFGYYSPGWKYIYSNYMKVTGKLITDRPNELLGKVVYCNQLNNFILVNKISKYANSNEPCEVEGLLVQPITAEYNPFITAPSIITVPYSHTGTTVQKKFIIEVTGAPSVRLEAVNTNNVTIKPTSATSGKTTIEVTVKYPELLKIESAYITYTAVYDTEEVTLPQKTYLVGIGSN